MDCLFSKKYLEAPFVIKIQWRMKTTSWTRWLHNLKFLPNNILCLLRKLFNFGIKNIHKITESSIVHQDHHHLHHIEARQSQHNVAWKIALNISKISVTGRQEGQMIWVGDLMVETIDFVALNPTKNIQRILFFQKTLKLVKEKSIIRN